MRKPRAAKNRASRAIKRGDKSVPFRPIARLAVFDPRWRQTHQDVLEVKLALVENIRDVEPDRDLRRIDQHTHYRSATRLLSQEMDGLCENIGYDDLPSQLEIRLSSFRDIVSNTLESRTCDIDPVCRDELEELVRSSGRYFSHNYLSSDNSTNKGLGMLEAMYRTACCDRNYWKDWLDG